MDCRSGLDFMSRYDIFILVYYLHLLFDKDFERDYGRKKCEYMVENNVSHPELQRLPQENKKKAFLPVLFVVLFVVLQLVCYTWVLQHNYSRNTVETAVERNTLRMDTIYETLIDLLADEDFSAINGREDMDTEVYARLQGELDQMRKLKTVRYLYTAKRNAEGTPVYLVDGLDLDAEDFAYPGTPIEEEIVPCLEDALSGKTSFSQDIVDTTWGHIFAAFYPVYSKENPEEIIGALCIEIDMESTYKEIERNNRNTAVTAVIAVAVASLLIIMVHLWMRRLNKRDIERRRQLDEAYERTAKANIELEKAHKDIQAALNAAEAANKAKTDFLSKMSHDIRTPLNGIIGLLEMNERHPDDQDLIKGNTEKMKVAAKHLNSLLNDILQLSKLESGNVELAHEVFDLNALAADIITMAAIEANERGIAFYHGDCSGNLIAPYVYGSPLHLRQIFLNIFSNAIKYNKPNGSISCKAECSSIDGNTVTYSCTISDTGIGMSKEFVEHIFEPFSQERNDARSTYQGTGLGMAIVKSLVDKMGGTIDIQSTEGEGSSFVVTIPFEIAQPSEMGNAQQEETEASIQNLRILLVEDNELNMEIAQYLLEDAGAVVTKAFDGKQAVDLFAGNPAGTFDVILMDVMMPVMNGIEAAKTIRLMDRSDAQMIPIIAMTANAFDEDRQATKNAGMNAHLSKPLDGKEVLRVISNTSL